MSLIDECFAANRRWAETTVAADPRFFKRLAALQDPDLLWIGCSDSRLPPNEIIGRAPGEVFVHRNVANVVEHNDVNSVARHVIDDYVLRTSDEQEPYERLTDREREVLKLLAEGRTNREIADTLVISVKTVLAHRAKIMEKLDIHNRTELVKYALRKGLISVNE